MLALARIYRRTAMYLDKVLNEVKEPGEVFTVSRERATILERAKVAKIKE